jgi:hypothetical protein
MADWKHLSGEIGLNPDFIAKIRPPIDSIFQTINVTLDLLQDILSFVKNFLIDFTQPIKIIIDTIIAQLKALLLDLRQMGVYYTSDMDLLDTIKKSGLEKFSRGYSGFQTRMINKLSNTADPTRPNFSNATSTLSLFVVSTIDLGGFVGAINTIMNLIELFTGKIQPSPDPDPVNIKAQITKGLFPVNIQNTIDYDGVKITWDIVPPPGASVSAFPSFVNPPEAFLIHVRTRPEPFYIGYKHKPKSRTVQDEFFRSVYYLNDEPARLYGGVELFDVKDKENTYFLEEPSSEEEYSIDMVKDTGHTFYYEPSNVGSFILGSSYSLKIDKDKIPKSKEYDKKNKTFKEVSTSKLFIDIVSCSSKLGYDNGSIVTGKIPLVAADVLNYKVKSPFKTTDAVSHGQVVLPLNESKDYYDAVKNALAIYFLGGYFADDMTDNRMELSDEAQVNIRAYLNKKSTDMDLLPKSFKLFRKDINLKIASVINRMALPPLSIINSLQKDISNLTKPYIRDPRVPANSNQETTLYSLVKEYDLAAGISSNKNNFLGEVNELVQDKLFGEETRYDLPTICYTGKEMTKADLISTQINALTDGSIIKDVLGELKGKENILLRDSAKRILEYVPKRKRLNNEGAWLNYKFFEDGIPEFEQFVKLIINFLESFSLGLDGIIKAIKQYIDLIILKIEELQILINKIKSIIDYLLNLKISLGAGLSMLYSTNEGTRGIIENLLYSTNKPPKTSGETFAFGACFVFGGYPAFLPDLIAAFAGE